MAEQNQSNTNINSNQASTGLCTDLSITSIKQGMITDSLNANVSNFSGEGVSYQNDLGNLFCFEVPAGYKVINVTNILQLNSVYYFLTNPTTGYSMVGYVFNNNCIFIPLLDDTFPGSDLMNFNINHPILKTVVKTTNCGTQIYFTDYFNPRRFIDLSVLPWADNIILGVVTPIVGQIDINKLLIQPIFSIPIIQTTQINIGGNLPEGNYQFALCYGDSTGNAYTSYYSVTNSVRIFLHNKISLNYNEITNLSISLNITDLDNTGLYDYFNLAVIKTINSAQTVELVGTFSIQGKTFTHTYTGDEQNSANIKLTIQDILEQNNYYDLANTLAESDNSLIWGGLVKEDDINYQLIWNQVPVQWQTHSIPYNNSESYKNGINCANFQGYHRDEVYALEGCFLLGNGKQSVRCHIPARAATAYDLAIIGNNGDVIAIETGTCPTPSLPRWRVYNTGELTGDLPGSADPCTGIKPYQYGKMAYWESTYLYPNKPEVWGALANQPIRHHKFPDSLITHIHDQNPYVVGTDQYMNFQHTIYPIGFLINPQDVFNAIQSSALTDAQKRQIVGFKIMRSDRGPDRAILAKGFFYNCGQYAKDNTEYYYANYPFNDVNPDVYISNLNVEDKSGANTGSRLNNFQKNRYTFHSPDTHFYQPSGIEGAFIKLETSEYGFTKSHFVQVQKNAGEKIRTINAVELALIGGLLSTIGLNFSSSVGTLTDVTASPTFDLSNFFPSYNNMLEIMDKLTPYYNYAWQYNGLGDYGNFKTVPNDTGNKIRYINFGGYLIPGLQGTFGDEFMINNTLRESSVYVSLNNNLPYTHEQGAPQDNSRVTSQEMSFAGIIPVQSSASFFRDISCYYGSIKRYIPDQYGEIFSYIPVDTGTFTKFVDSNNTPIDHLYIFGGDVFINRFALKIKQSFFLNNSTELPDGADVFYNQDAVSHEDTGNIGYPIWYYSTVNKPYVMGSLTRGAYVDLLNIIQGTSITHPATTISIIVSVVLAVIGIVPLGIELFVGLLTDGFLTTAGLKLTNLDNYDGGDIYEKGMAYQYAYGIINFFVESEVNVDMRQAYNTEAGNFFPNVGTSIPDHWLQQVVTPIINDNSYVYNKTYSRQNKETFFGLLRPNWEPNQVCYTTYPNRAIWSDKSNLEEVKNNWLVYKPANYKDFPKTNGSITAIDSMDNRAVLVRFETSSQIYNAMNTIATSGITAIIGSGRFFGEQPLDLATTDNNYSGSQHKFFLSTEHGHVFVNSMGGEIILLKGNSMEVLSSEKYLNSKWFKNNLSFNILKSYPDFPIDNNYNGLGFTGTYDGYYDRLTITKIDYELTDPTVKWDGTNFYIDDIVNEVKSTIGKEVVTCCPEGYSIEPIAVSPEYPLGLGCFTEGPTIPPIPCGELAGVTGTKTCCPDGFEYITIEGETSFCWDPIHFVSVDPTNCPDVPDIIVLKNIIKLGDPLYFCNKSWTISFSFITNSWVGWHSFIPNFYVEYADYFQSGLNTDVNSNNDSTIWDHNSTFSLFNSYYGVQYPYILEYPFVFKMKNEVLQSVKDYCTVLRYTDFDQFIELNEVVYFNKVICFNNQQCTGVRNLIPKDNTNLYASFQYPKYNFSSIDILVTKNDNLFQYNMLWDIVVNPDVNIWVNTCTPQLGNKNLNLTNLSFTNQSFKKYPLRAKNLKIRNILDNRNDVCIVSHFILNQTQNSIK